MSNLTTNQIKALVFNAIGRGAETQIYSPYRLSWAGNGSSGLSLGFMQWDFGQRLSASSTNTLVLSYNSWADTTGASKFLNETELKTFLAQTGVAAGTASNSSTALNLNQFFVTASGRDYVAALEDKSFAGAPGILGIKPFADRILSTAFVQGLDDTDTRIVLAGVLDIFNRSPGSALKVLGKLSAPNLTVAGFRSDVIDTLLGDLPEAANKAMDTAALKTGLSLINHLLAQLGAVCQIKRCEVYLLLTRRH